MPIKWEVSESNYLSYGGHRSTYYDLNRGRYTVHVYSTNGSIYGLRYEWLVRDNKEAENSVHCKNSVEDLEEAMRRAMLAYIYWFALRLLKNCTDQFEIHPDGDYRDV